MTEITNLLIGVVVLALGFPLGIYLARITSDESKEGQKWFKLITISWKRYSAFQLRLYRDCHEQEPEESLKTAPFSCLYVIFDRAWIECRWNF
jgi:hypothetical protein